MSERACAQQLLDTWGSEPAVFNGVGGTAHQDLAVASATANLVYESVVIPTVFSLGRTWVLGQGGGPDHWAMVINRYNYLTGAPIGTPVTYPNGAVGSDYFVPVAIKIIQVTPNEDAFLPKNTAVVVTGYRPASSYGLTDIRTVCFDGNLDMQWDNKFTRKLTPIVPGTPFPDEYAVGLDAQVGGPFDAVITVTGNSYNGTDWDIASVFYALDGSVLLTDFQGTVGANDLSAGVSMRGNNMRAFIVGTMNDGALGNSIKAFRYSPPSTTVETLTYSSGATLKANAMTGVNTADGFTNMAVAAGKAAGIDETYMVMARFDFHTNSFVDAATFAPPPGQTTFRYAEAAAIDFKPASEQALHAEFYAIAGHGFRDAAHGFDSLVCLFDSTTSPPRLRWSSWLNQNENVAVADFCTKVAIDKLPSATSDDQFFVYAAGQRPNGNDLDWRIAAYNTDIPEPPFFPTEPGDKSPWGNLLGFAGSGSGNDIPLSIDLNPIPDTPYHNFIITGNIFNGTGAGDDILTRRIRFVPPQ